MDEAGASAESFLELKECARTKSGGLGYLGLGPLANPKPSMPGAKTLPAGGSLPTSTVSSRTCQARAVREALGGA